MASNPRSRKDDRRAGGGGAPRPEDSSEYPNLPLLRKFLVRDGDLFTPDERDAFIKAITLIDKIDFQGYGAICEACGEGVPTGMPSPLAPVVCPVCLFWADRIMTDNTRGDVSNWFSIRDKGQHFVMSRDFPEGPLMTVRYFTGVRVVTTRLKMQGPVPARLRSTLVDNAFVIEGNPEGLVMGITLP